MPDIVTVQGTAIAVHRKASSACCGAKVAVVDPAVPPDEHQYECRSCGQPAQRVLGEPRRIAAGFGGAL